MKSTHEPFDEELRRRLRNYSEMPDKDLWQSVLPRIVSINPEARRFVWVTRLSILIVAFSGAYFVFTSDDAATADERGSQSEVMEPEPLLSSAIDTLEGLVHSVEQNRSGLKNITQNDFGISVSDVGNQETPEREWKVMRSDVPSTTTGVASIPVEFDPALTAHESVAADLRKNLSETANRENQPTEIALTQIPNRKKKSEPSKETGKKKKSFSLYFTAMPTFGYQRIESNDDDGIWIESIKRIPAFSAERLGVRLEAGAEVPVSQRWRVFGGFLYFQRKQTIGYTERDQETITPERGGYLPQYTYVSKSIEYELKNAGAQIGLTYQLWMGRNNSSRTAAPHSPRAINLKQRKFSHVVGSGIEFHKPLNQNRSFERAEGFSNPSMYVFFNAYYRLQYPNTGKLRAVLQPTLNYSFFINEDFNAPFYVKPYGLGLNFGCTYHIR